MESGRLSEFDIQRVITAQRETGLAFGEQAVRTGLVSQQDVRFALSQQFSLPYLPKGHEGVDAEVIAAFEPNHDVVERLRKLRGQIALHALDADPPLRSIAVMSTDRHAGRSYISANLAIVFAQVGVRTLLIDADYENPRQHDLFRRNNRTGLSLVLAGRASLSAAHEVPYLPLLTVLGAGPTPPNPQDLLARPALGQFLRDCERSFGVILIDTPAWNVSSGARHIAAAAGAALKVVRVGRTAAQDARALARDVTACGCRLLGVVMNLR